MNTKFTLSRLIEWYTELTDTKSKKSYDRIKQVLVHVERVIGGDVLISQLQPSMMEKYKKTRLKEPSRGRKERTVAPAIINKEITFCKAMLNKAVLDGELMKEFQRNYRQVVKDAKLGDFTFHDLRRCAINNMRLAGYDDFSIKAQSGHMTMAVFKRYNLISNAELENTKWLDETEEITADVDRCVNHKE